MTTNLIKTDVTVVKFYKTFIVAGIGNHLQIYDRNNLCLIERTKIFIAQKIHEIKVANNFLIVLGGKEICVVADTASAESIQIRLCSLWEHSDWILDAAYIEKTAEIAVISAHNIASFYKRNILNKPISETICVEKCLLYYASIVESELGPVIILTGTVFSEIIIWAPQISGQVLYRLQGHKGVIFSVIYNETQRLICSTSDDRSVRLWDVNVDSIAAAVQNKSNVAISCRSVLYGHTARVWRSCILTDRIISIGEDSTINIWSRDGDLIRRIFAHQNDCIWSLDVSEKDNQILSGGGDSGICVYPLKENLQVEMVPVIADNADVFKKLAFMTDDSIVCVTEQGFVWFWRLSLEWSLINKHSDLKNIVLEVSACRTKALLAGFSPIIYLYSIINANLQLTKKLTLPNMCYIFSINWLNCTTAIVCTNSGELWEVNVDDEMWTFRGVLPKMKERWLTAAVIFNNILLVGDRGGNLHLYNLQNLIQSLFKVHGRLGIACLVAFDDLIISTGRDGTIKNFRLCKDEVLNEVSQIRLPFKWCSHVLPNINIALGFLESRLQIWHMKLRRTLMEIECGGGHRSWDFIINNEKCNFIYIKDKRIHFIRFTIDKFKDIESGFHSKEINTMVAISVAENMSLLVSGGEDTTLRLSHYEQTNKFKFDSQIVQNNHLSSIRCLDLVQLPNVEDVPVWIVVSGGGRAQLVMCQIKDNSQVVECSHLATHTLKIPNRKSEKSMLGIADVDPETRIMDVKIHKCSNDRYSIFAGCSDGLLRIYNFTHSTRELNLIYSLNSSAHCILKLLVVEFKCEILILTMTTEGSIYFWNLSSIVKMENPLDDKYLPFYILKAHQSGINSCNYLITDSGSLLLVTGGDDCSVRINVVDIKDCSNAELLSFWSTNKFHTAQVTGILIANNIIISCGIDQRITLFRFATINNVVKCEYLHQITTTIADLQGIFRVSDMPREDLVIGVYGKGFETINVSSCIHKFIQ